MWRTAGHILLNIISEFIYKFITTSYIIAILSIIPFTLFIALVGLEVIVAVLQAYVWCVLTSIYIKDSINLH